jgi:hypothetical protein
VWYGEVPFYLLFLNLFAKAKTPRVITVAQVWNKGNIKIPLTREASLLLRREKSEVIDILSSLSDNFCGQDSVVWSLTPSRVYTVRSMYLFFMHTSFLTWKDIDTIKSYPAGMGGPVSCPCCYSILEIIDHLFVFLPSYVRFLA